MVSITGTEKNSLAEEAGIKAGDFLISVNGHDIADVLDYRFYITERRITLRIHRGPELLDIKIAKDEYDDIGLCFETYLMDRQHTCKNKCVFCFIDQNPPGMRKSIYFKDDDSRMSYLSGSYITLTNLTEREIERIIEMKMSPVNISVHTTEPKLRVEMMKNPDAGNSLSVLRRFCDAGIEMNCQIVLCRGINDNEHLDITMADLSSLESVNSVSVVPAGITDHREGLYPLVPFSGVECAEVISQVNSFGDKCKKTRGKRLFYCSDEFYIKSGIPLPDENYYDGYPQLENGVGSIASMRGEFYDCITGAEYTGEGKTVSVATGEAAYGFISEISSALEKRFPKIKINVYKIRNDFFGKNITVAGLITGRDIISQLSGKELGKTLILPSVMLRFERDMFLDDTRLEEISDALGVEVVLCENDGYDFIEKITN